MNRHKKIRYFIAPIALCIALLCNTFASAGSWGPGILDNDSALDFLTQVTSTNGAELVRNALDTALTDESPLEDEQASRALAAAELVAAMKGDASNDLPAIYKEWAVRHSIDANSELVISAVDVVDRIGRDSETRELMQEGGVENFQLWQASLGKLRARLTLP